ncbi:hypothetical protein QU617_10040 [Pseudomonas guariconensis]|nr:MULTISPECIES: hypothetical protein [Pseudomonas]MDM9593651.1 hypothetical protein [Pseudomonas guariconensis]MDM9606478.1 hypothetical protein [Pseudomonas guariconensis]MDM9611434.1 hypothetical protein [Pseudomonas guariconensis]URD41426.1 hypothetical protein M6G63_18550 [Pseudomonas sp. BYT-5]URK96777.1 hypothetical protein J5X93_19215 [Pseudomonas sp. BYT-1]
MAAQYGFRTRDASGAITLDTSVTPLRSIYTTQVQGNGAWDQYFSIPQIKAGSFVVVQSPIVNMSSGVEAWWSPGTLHLRRAQSLKWTVKVLSYGDAPDATTKYGIRARNDNNLVQIDNVNKVMSVAGSGSFQIGRRGPGDYITTGRGNFPAPITTIEEPYVFLRSDTGMMVCKYRVLGSPGAWTGFTVDGWFGGSFANLLYTVHWMVGSATPSGAEGDYGIRIRNGSGERTFNSNDNLILLSGGAPSSDRFSVAGSDVVIGSVLWSSFQMPWTGSANDYFLASTLLSTFDDGANVYDNPAGFLVGNRNVLQAYSGSYTSSTNASGVNGRTLFAGRPMRPL